MKLIQVILTFLPYLISSNKLKWVGFKNSVQELWDDKGMYIAGILYKDYGINIEKIPHLYEFITQDIGCWCQSADRKLISGHKISDEYDKICKQYHKCIECAGIKSCNYRNVDLLNIKVKGHVTTVQAKSPYESEDQFYMQADLRKEEFVKYEKKKLKCNTKDQCRHGLCECSRYLYESFAKLIAADYEKVLSDYIDANNPALHPGNGEGSLNVFSSALEDPIQYFQQQRIEASEEVCTPPKKLAKQEIMGEILARSFAGLSPGGGSPTEVELEMAAAVPSGFMQRSARVSSPTEDLTHLDQVDAEEIDFFTVNYEQLLKDYQSLAINDPSYVNIYEKLRDDYAKFQEILDLSIHHQSVNPSMIPDTIKKAWEIYKNTKTPKDHQKAYLTDLVEQDDHLNYRNNNECCGELPHWYPFNNQNGQKACCGKSADPKSYKTYSIDFFTCCDGEATPRGQGGCLADSFLQEAEMIENGIEHLTFGISEAEKIEIYTENSDYYEDEDSENIEVIPGSYNQPDAEDLMEDPNLVLSETDLEILDQQAMAVSSFSPGMSPADSLDGDMMGFTLDDMMGDSFIMDDVSLGQDVVLNSDTLPSDSFDDVLVPFDADELPLGSYARSFQGQSAQASENPLWSRTQCYVKHPDKFGTWATTNFCTEKIGQVNPVTYNNKWLYPDRSCQYYIDCNTDTLIKCGKKQIFNGIKCVNKWPQTYTDINCGEDFEKYNYGMAFEIKSYTGETNHQVTLNYDDTCVSKLQNSTPEDDLWCQENCGCDGSECKGCQEQDACLARCHYKTNVGDIYGTKKNFFCHKLKPERSNLKLLWTDWDCKRYIDCSTNEVSIKTCPDGQWFSARDNNCVNGKSIREKCGRWLKFSAKNADIGNYKPTWNRDKCVYHSI